MQSKFLISQLIAAVILTVCLATTINGQAAPESLKPFNDLLPPLLEPNNDDAVGKDALAATATVQAATITRREAAIKTTHAPLSLFKTTKKSYYQQQTQHIKELHLIDEDVLVPHDYKHHAEHLQHLLESHDSIHQSTLPKLRPQKLQQQQLQQKGKEQQQQTQRQAQKTHQNEQQQQQLRKIATVVQPKFIDDKDDAVNEQLQSVANAPAIGELQQRTTNQFNQKQQQQQQQQQQQLFNQNQSTELQIPVEVIQLSQDLLPPRLDDNPEQDQQQPNQQEKQQIQKQKQKQKQYQQPQQKIVKQFESVQRGQIKERNQEQNQEQQQQQQGDSQQQRKEQKQLQQYQEKERLKQQEQKLREQQQRLEQQERERQKEQQLRERQQQLQQQQQQQQREQQKNSNKYETQSRQVHDYHNLSKDDIKHYIDYFQHPTLHPRRGALPTLTPFPRHLRK